MKARVQNCFTKFLFSFFLILIGHTLFAQTISPKRGVAGDLLDNADCITADSLTWYYNWANTPNNTVISTYQNYLDFCPMLWNGNWDSTALCNYLVAHPEVKYLLGFNEPNYSVQANMTPSQAAAIWPKVEAIANTYNLKIVGPAMSYCSGTCVPGYNNAHGDVWLDDFFSICPTCRVDYIGLHIYDTWYWGFRGVANIYKKYNRPIWITEFDYSGATTPTQHASLMVDVIDYMEKDPDIMRYAWFLVRSSPSAGSTDIFSQTTGVLADLGKVYNYMSSYDNAFYHQVNAIIEAEHYISKSVTYCIWDNTTSTCSWPYSVLLEPTTDVTGKLDAYHFASPNAYANDTLFYNVDIPTTQTYTMDFRVNSTANSSIEVRSYPGNVLLGTTPSLNTSGAWSTVTLSGVNLTAGQQRIYLTASNGAPLKLNWLRINCSSNCGTLPVELISFEAHSLAPSQALLEWETAYEEHNDHFVIEKSIDGIHFIPIDTLKAANNSNGYDYHYTDLLQKESVCYYRLQQVDNDGSYTYSPIRKITNASIQISASQQGIMTHFSSDQKVSFELYSSSGQFIQGDTYTAKAGTYEYPLLLKNATYGIYILHIISDEMVQSLKIPVQH